MRPAPVRLGVGTAVAAPVTPPAPVAPAPLRALDPPPPAVPLWLRLADECQRSLRRPFPVALALAVATTVALAVSGSRAAIITAACLLAVGMVTGLWKRRSTVQAQGVAWYGRRLMPAAGATAGGLYLAGDLTARRATADALAMAATLVMVQGLVWVLVAAARRRSLGLSRTLLIGSENQVADAAHRIALAPEAGLACVHSHVSNWRPDSPARSQALIEALLEDHAVEHVVCTAGDAAGDTVARDLIRYAPPTVDVTVIHPVPLAASAPARIGDAGVTCLGRAAWGADTCKRALDLVVSALLLAALSPVMAITAVAIRLGDPGPAVFRQRRTGLGNRQFTIYKFRSMVRDAEARKADVMDRNVADGLLFKAEDDPRITRVGGFIRRFSIDELPQLWNVVKGEMSLVGPRPLPTEFDDADVFARIRHQVLPGITGLWQVKGANALPYDDMIDLDCSYVATRSLGLDLRILLQTVPAVLVRRDPY